MQNLLVRITSSARAVFILPALAVAVIYFQSIHFDLVWDDVEWVRRLAGFEGNFLDWMAYSFTHPTIGQYYRPLALLTFFYPAAEMSPPVVGWHQASYVLYLANTVLLGLILANLYRDAAVANPGQVGGWHRFAGIALVLFVALHPAQVETAVWVSCRFDLMSNAFLLGILWLDTAAVSKARKTMLVPLLFLCALLAKETAVVFLALYPLLHLLAEPGSSLQSVLLRHRYRYGLMLAVTLVYAAAYLVFAGRENIVSLNGFSPLYEDFPSHVRLIVATLGYYLRLFFYPLVELSPYYHQAGSITVADPRLWLGVAGLVFLAYALIRQRAILPVLLVWLLAVFPYLNWMQLSFSGNIIQNRYVSLSLVVTSVAAYMFLLRCRPLAWQKKLLAGFAAYIFLLGMATVSIVPLWQHNLDLWSWIVRENPQSAIARANLGHTLMTAQRHDLAIVELEASLHIRDNFFAHATLARIFLEATRGRQAYEHATQALSMDFPPERKLALLEELAGAAGGGGQGQVVVGLLHSLPESVRNMAGFHRAEARIIAALNQGHD